MTVSKEFVLAGNATFTVQLPAGMERPHYTYRVQKIEANDRWPESYFVKLLTGPDNTSDYSYRLLNRVLARVWTEDHAAYEQFGYSTHHEGKCGRCGRKLTVPRSVETGIGPECEKMLAGV